MSKEITNVSIDVLKVHPRNLEFFDDISGDEYEKFKKSIQEEGIILEIIVSPDMTIISGHQRYKAAKELGIKMIPIRIREDLIDEDKKLKVLLAANFGRTKADANAKARIETRELGYTNTKKNNIKEIVDPAITVSKVNTITKINPISINTDKISAPNNLEKVELWG